MRKYFLLAIIVCLLLSCETNNNLSVETSSFRITEIIDTNEDGEEYIKSELEYFANRLVQILIYTKDENDDWVLDVKHEFTYKGSIIEETVLILKNHEWIVVQGTDRKVENGNLIEYIDYSVIDGNKHLSSKSNYHYNSGLLTSWIDYEYSNNSWEETREGNIEREAEKVTEYRYISYYPNNMVSSLKYIPEYSGTQIIENTSYWYLFDKWQESSKTTYSYSDGLVDKTTYLSWNSSDSSWVEHTSESYKYEGELLIESSSSDGRSSFYEYESGESNMSLIGISPTSILDAEPNPYNQ